VSEGRSEARSEASAAVRAERRSGIVEGATFWGLLCRRAERTPDRLMFLDGSDRRVGFAEFRDRAERVAAGLFARGVRAGTRVSWQLPTRIDTVLLSVALSRLGAVQNPIIALYREREVGSLLRQTEAELYAVVSNWRSFSYRGMAEKLRAEIAKPFEILCVDEGLPDGDPAILPPAPTDGDVVRWHYSTSGTTSAPKVVLHTDRSLIAGGTGLAEALRPDPENGEIGSIVFPYAHIGGPDYVVMALRYGLPVLLLDQFSIPTPSRSSAGSGSRCPAAARPTTRCCSPSSGNMRIGRSCRPCGSSRAAARRCRPRSTGRSGKSSASRSATATA
jgi:cyclohexanecarboxylate-CoA ligase